MSRTNSVTSRTQQGAVMRNQRRTVVSAAVWSEQYVDRAAGCLPAAIIGVLAALGVS